MPEAGLTELLQAGVHFGHQTRRWNPNMRRFIFDELDGIHIIDLLQTEQLLASASRFATEVAAGGGQILFDAAFSRQGDRIVTAGADGTARIWDADTGKPVGVVGTGHGPVFSAAFTPDGGLVLTASGYDGSARL